jgi:hypothetical protein
MVRSYLEHWFAIRSRMMRRYLERQSWSPCWMLGEMSATTQLPVSWMIKMERGIHLPSRQISGLPQGKSRSALRSVTNIATTRVPHMGRILSSQLRVASDAESTTVHAIGYAIYSQWLGRTKRTRFLGSCKARCDRSGAASIAVHERVESTPCLEAMDPFPVFVFSSR